MLLWLILKDEDDDDGDDDDDDDDDGDDGDLTGDRAGGADLEE